jgi:transposase
VRYGDGGGLTAAGRAKREQVRLQAAELFAAGFSAVQVAKTLEVSEKSARSWRRSWVAGGEQALVSKGPSGPQRKLSQAQLSRLQVALQAGALAQGYEDDRWTLTRVKTLIGKLFHVSVSVAGVWRVLKRMGWSAQIPVRRATQRDEDAIAAWRRHQWPAIKESRAGWARGSVSSTRQGTR